MTTTAVKVSWTDIPADATPDDVRDAVLTRAARLGYLGVMTGGQASAPCWGWGPEGWFGTPFQAADTGVERVLEWMEGQGDDLDG